MSIRHRLAGRIRLAAKDIALSRRRSGVRIPYALPLSFFEAKIPLLCQPKGVLQLFCNYSFSKASFFTLEDIKRPRHNAARSRLRIRRPSAHAVTDVRLGVISSSKRAAAAA